MLLLLLLLLLVLVINFVIVDGVPGEISGMSSYSMSAIAVVAQGKTKT